MPPLRKPSYSCSIRQAGTHFIDFWICIHLSSHHNIRFGVKTRYIGDGHPTFNRNPYKSYNGYINPYYWVDDHPLLYGNHGSLDPGTYKWYLCFVFFMIQIQRRFFHVKPKCVVLGGTSCGRKWKEVLIFTVGYLSQLTRKFCSNQPNQHGDDENWVLRFFAQELLSGGGTSYPPWN